MMKKYRLTATVMEYYKGNLTEVWDAEDVVIAEDEVDAYNMFIDSIVDTHCAENVDVDVDDINYEEIGPADVFIHSSKETFHPYDPTMTVGELIDYLKENFDRDSNIYMVRYAWPGYQYSSIVPYKIDCKEED